MCTHATHASAGGVQALRPRVCTAHGTHEQSSQAAPLVCSITGTVWTAAGMHACMHAQQHAILAQACIRGVL